MDDKSIKNLAATVLENKEPIIAILNTIQPDDIRDGRLLIPDRLLEEDLYDYILNLAVPYLKNYSVRFENDTIFLNVTAKIKVIDELIADYALKFDQFEFDEEKRTISITYEENISSQGNFLQKGLINLVGIKGTYLNKAFKFIKLPFISANAERITVDLNKTDFATSIPPGLTLEYKGAQDGVLEFNFTIDL